MLVPPPEALFVAKANTKAKRKRKPKKRRRKKDSLIDDEAEEDDEEDEEALGADDEGEAKAEPGSAETGEPEIHEHPEARIGSVQVSTVDAFQGAEKGSRIYSSNLFCSILTSSSFRHYYCYMLQN
jgi:hypothetical protein